MRSRTRPTKHHTVLRTDSKRPDARKNKLTSIALCSLSVIVLLVIVCISILPLWHLQTVLYPKPDDTERAQMQMQMHPQIRIAYGLLTTFGVANAILCTTMISYMVYLFLSTTPVKRDAMGTMILYMGVAGLAFILLVCMIVLYMYYRYSVDTHTNTNTTHYE